MEDDPGYLDPPVGGGATPATAPTAPDTDGGRTPEEYGVGAGAEEVDYDEATQNYPVARVLHAGTPTPSRCAKTFLRPLPRAPPPPDGN